jgi:hypothetical protein
MAMRRDVFLKSMTFLDRNFGAMRLLAGRMLIETAPYTQ